jgi:hypothetical protein
VVAVRTPATAYDVGRGQAEQLVVLVVLEQVLEIMNRSLVSA